MATFGSDIAMTTTSPGPLPVKTSEIQSSEGAKKTHAPQRRGRRKAAPVSWYSRLLIVSMLLVAAGWELFQWIVTIVTLD